MPKIGIVLCIIRGLINLDIFLRCMHRHEVHLQRVTVQTGMLVIVISVVLCIVAILILKLVL